MCVGWIYVGDPECGMFQVGDLVKLSSYGKSVKTNTKFLAANDSGMIININEDGTQYSEDFPYEVKWFCLPDKDRMCHSRQDLKYAR